MLEGKGRGWELVELLVVGVKEQETFYYNGTTKGPYI